MRDHSHHIQLTREEAVRQMLAALDAVPAGFGRGSGYGESAPRDGIAGSASGGDVEGSAPVSNVEGSVPVSNDEGSAPAGVDNGLAPGIVERVSIAAAQGRVLARDAVSLVDAPNCLTCMMDSIAVHFDDFAAAAAGEGPLPDTSAWVRGRDWEFANTGTAMPDGFDTAIVVEHVVFSDDGKRVLSVDAAPSKRFAGTRPAGSRLHAGDVLAKAGTVITPDIAARIASGNNATVAVVRRPRVAFIPTGDELQTPGSPFVAHGKNVETNSILAQVKIEAWGGEFMPFQTIHDSYDQIKQTVLEACSMADIVVLNAGSSKGSGDWSCEVLDEIGHVICHQTNHGPGHHSSYTMVGGTPVVGISGPAGGASATLDFYLRPVMRRFLGLDPVLPKVPVILAEAFPAGGHGHHGPADAGSRAHALPGEKRPKENGPDGFFSIKFLNIEHAADGTLVAHPVLGNPGSAAVAACNGYYMMPCGLGDLPPKAGDVILAEYRA